MRAISRLWIAAAALLVACQAATATTVSPTASAPPTVTSTAQATSTLPASPTVPPSGTPSAAKPMPASGQDADVIVDFGSPLGQPPDTFGVNGWWTDEDAQIWQQRYAELNPRVVRLPLIHAVVEPENDNDNPEASDSARFYFDTPFPVDGERHITYAKWFAALREADFTVMVFIPYLAPWLSRATDSSPLAAPYPPNDLAEYQELIRVLLTYLVEEIGFSPEKIILEPVNEPDLNCGADPAVSCFWQNWQVEDLAAVLESASQAAEAVDPRIRVAGPTLCCRMNYLDRLVEQYRADDYLDILTFHDYEEGPFNPQPTLRIAGRMQNYGKPVYLDEYGSKNYWSNGEKGALWHAAMLSEFWKANLPPIQFSMAEMPWMHEGYNELGLFSSWEEAWQVKPAYWVYVNFFNNLPERGLVSISTPPEMPGVAARGDDQSLAVWLTNGAYQKAGEITLRVENWPSPHAQVQVLDNLTGPAPVDAFEIAPDASGSLAFAYPIPPLNSLLFLITAAEAP